MRILQLRFKNLNSLVGEWEIDFSHPAFSSDGIFAITGPTGAGKTTILDAICLALYGRTPRLSRVTKGDNEIMSRQTGECFAEVTFETKEGRFRCHWSQRRARKRSDGGLQTPRHEISDADSGEILEAKLRGVADRIEAASGMHFDQFTRSMLLAQGGFAAFLLAAPDERAPILEQITGTEIYSRISVRIHERRSEEGKKLDALQAELAGMALLSLEDEQQLVADFNQKKQQDLELNRRIGEKNQTISWLDGIARIEEELKSLDVQRDALRKKMEDFAPEQERLRLASQALELAGDYSALESVRSEQESDRRTLEGSQASLPACDEAVELAKEAMKAADGRLETKRLEQTTALPVIREVRELDLKIDEKGAPIKAATTSITEYQTSLEALRTKQYGDCADLESKRKALVDVLEQLEKTKADEGLVENLAGIRERCEALRYLQGQLVGKLGERNHAEVRLLDASRSVKEQTTILAASIRRRDGVQDSLAVKRAELECVLTGRELADWRKSQSSLTSQRELLTKAFEAVQSLSSSKQALDKLGTRETELSTEESALVGQLENQEEKRIGLENRSELLGTQLTLLNKIEDLEVARHQLHDGEPCPLCGAEEHPFAEGNVPVPDETRQRLTEVKLELRSVTNEILTIKVRLAQIGKDQEQMASDRKEHVEKIGEANRSLVRVCADLRPGHAIKASDPDLKIKLQALQDDVLQALELSAKTVEAAEILEMALSTLRESLDKAKESVAKAESETQSALHHQDIAVQLSERLGKEADAVRSQQEKALGNLQKDLHAFGVDALSIDNLDSIQQQLNFCRDRWVRRQKQKAELNPKITALETQTRHQAEQIRKSEIEIEKRQGARDGLIREQDILMRKRQDVFAAKHPDHEEAALAAAVQSASEEFEAARQTWSTALQELGQLKSRVDELEKSIGVRDEQLKISQQAFQMRLNDSGFTDEEHYKSACLPEQERKTLTQQARNLSEENTKLSSMKHDKNERLNAERQKRMTDEPRDELGKALKILVANQKGLQQEIGGIQQKLKDNEELKQKQKDRLQAIDAQQRECSRWDVLHELIGSADGKKYRNFAQGLTFEMMIGHANRQLQKMTDRYLLLRDDHQPLELNVIDNYQAGEIRSTKNLSGGESFIVSLALALGLSHMASKNVRVDSLFLDEGFGTLDEEALDTALETLAGLQQEGKLIGVISHVPALKERIGTRIQVTPKTGGRSRISGPGCGTSATST